MNNIFRAFIAVALIAMSSCAKDDVAVSVSGDEVEIAYNVSFDDATRSLGEGKTANYVWFAVYKKNGSVYQLSKVFTPAPIIEGTADCRVTMMRGQSYKVVFVAQHYAEESSVKIPAYQIDALKARLLMPETAQIDSDRYDVFCAVDEVTDYKGAEAKKMVLSRIVAQVNFICQDWTDAATAVIKSAKVRLSNIPESYNLLDQTVSSSVTDVDYGSSDVKESRVGTVFCLSGESLDAYLILSDAEGRIKKEFGVAAIPAKPNYRTNVKLTLGSIN